MRVLLIEDDTNLCEVIQMALEQNGYQVDACHEGDDGLRWFREKAHDVVLLDRMLPRLDGVALLRQARGEGITTPVLMITAMDSLGQRVEGLDSGADDYISKPFEIEELLARIRAICRRPRQWEAVRMLQVGDLTYNPEQYQLTCRGNNTILTRKEGALLEVLLANHNQTMPRPLLLARVWGPDAGVEESNLDNYIHFLRRRLKDLKSSVSINTVRGIGYTIKD